MKDFQKGDKLSAADLNAIKKSATSPTRVTASGEAVISNTAGGLHINVPPRNDVKRSRTRTVIITKAPVAADEALTVKVVSYVNLPPVPCKEGASAGSYVCSIDTTSESYLALPDYGKKAIDYGSFFWDTAKQPDQTTTFLQARQEGGYWIVGFPAAGGDATDLCLVHAPIGSATVWSDSTDFIRVVHFKLNAAATGYVTAERQTPIPPEVFAPGWSVVRCWPGTKPTDWQYLQSTTGSLPAFTPKANAVFVATTMMNGVEYIMPVFPIAMALPDPALLPGDC